MYNNKLVVAIQVESKTLREFKEDGNSYVTIPFGSEYNIFLKNVETRKALCKVSIDGRNVIENLIVNPNSSISLERFFEGDMNSGHKLKFIEKTDSIREHRGDKPEDGLLRVEFQFEKEKQVRVIHKYGTIHPPWYYHVPRDKFQTTTIYSSNSIKSVKNISEPTLNYEPRLAAYASNFINCANKDDAGITVEGNKSSQSFMYSNIDELEEVSHVIVLMLKGDVGQHKKVQVAKPVFTRSKIACQYCGKRNESSSKFCSGCGAAVMITKEFLTV